MKEYFIHQFEHGGNIYNAAQKEGCDLSEIIDLSSNISPFFPTDIDNHIKINTSLNVLPEPFSRTLCKQYQSVNNINNFNIIAGSGTTEIIDQLCRLFREKHSLIIQPTYADYEKFATLHQHQISYISTTWETDFALSLEAFSQTIPHVDMVFICNPNNPTGTLTSKETFIELATRHPNTLFVVDESYMPFTDEAHSLIGVELPNIAILRSFSKIYGLPGLRLGFMITQNDAIASALHQSISEWSVNTIAQDIGLQLLNTLPDDRKAEIMTTKINTINALLHLKDIQIHAGHANYFLLRSPFKATVLCEELLKHHILIRNCSNFYNLDDQTVRISIKDQHSMNTFCNAITPILEEA